MEVDLPESDISCPNRTSGPSRPVRKTERARRDPALLCEPAREMRRTLEAGFGRGLLHEDRVPKQSGRLREPLFRQPLSGRLSKLEPQEAPQMPRSDTTVVSQSGDSVAYALRTRLPIGDAVQPASPENFSPHIPSFWEQQAGSLNMVRRPAASGGLRQRIYTITFACANQRDKGTPGRSKAMEPRGASGEILRWEESGCLRVA